jgi:hypothetical protein
MIACLLRKIRGPAEPRARAHVLERLGEGREDRLGPGGAGGFHPIADSFDGSTGGSRMKLPGQGGPPLAPPRGLAALSQTAPAPARRSRAAAGLAAGERLRRRVHRAVCVIRDRPYWAEAEWPNGPGWAGPSASARPWAAGSSRAGAARCRRFGLSSSLRGRANATSKVDSRRWKMRPTGRLMDPGRPGPELHIGARQGLLRWRPHDRDLT